MHSMTHCKGFISDFINYSQKSMLILWIHLNHTLGGLITVDISHNEDYIQYASWHSHDALSFSKGPDGTVWPFNVC